MATTLQEQLAHLEKNLSAYCALSRKATLNAETQRRVIKAELLVDLLRTHLQKSQLAAVPLAPTSNIQQDPQEAAEAQAAICMYENEDTPEDVFLKISKAEFVAALQQRVADPTGVDQTHLNLCGPAAFLVLWIERDPRSFTRAAIEVFQTGQSKYKEVDIKANRSMFNDENSANSARPVQLIDWMMLSSLQHASGLLGYNPNNELGGVRGIGLPHKVLDWFKQLSGGEAKKYKKDFKPSALNKLYKEDHYILFLVNVNLLDNYFSDRRFQNPDNGFFSKMATFFNGIVGNHYVVLNSPIRKEGDDLVFDLWTWANNLEIRIPGRSFKRAVVQTFVVEPEKEGDDA